MAKGDWRSLVPSSQSLTWILTIPCSCQSTLKWHILRSWKASCLSATCSFTCEYAGGTPERTAQFPAKLPWWWLSPSLWGFTSFKGLIPPWGAALCWNLTPFLCSPSGVWRCTPLTSPLTFNPENSGEPEVIFS